MKKYIDKYIKYKTKYNKQIIIHNLTNFKQQFPSFKFEPDLCDNTYFKELKELIESVNTSGIDFTMQTEEEIDKIITEDTCTYSHALCKPDQFNMEDTIQIILGRYNDNVGCFYKCYLYYALSYKTYSIYKNDLLIRYILNFPKLFNIEKNLNPIFPIRIIVNKQNIIPTHELIYTDNKDKYYSKFNMNGDIAEYTASEINMIKSNIYEQKLPYFTKLLSNTSKEGMITARELCSLFQYKYYFYGVLIPDTNIQYEPYILISKYNIHEIKKLSEFYINYNPNFDLLKLLFYKD